MRLKAIVEYEGSAYHGWQRQPNLPTVQGEVEKAMENLFNFAGDIKYASRTDSGVHSKGQVISFQCPDKFSAFRVEKALNYYLPEDIMLKRAEKCPLGFNPRYDNKGKHYVYRILNSKYNDYKIRKFVWHIPSKINWKLVKKGMKLMKGNHDFSLFSSPRGGKKNTQLNIRKIKLKRNKNLYCLHYESRYFLMHMIRHLTGFLVALGRDRETLNGLRVRLQGEGSRCVHVAPAKGLELKKVYI